MRLIASFFLRITVNVFQPDGIALFVDKLQVVTEDDFGAYGSVVINAPGIGFTIPLS